MALIKEKMTDFGIPASYWKVGMITIDRNLKEGSYCLWLYFNKEATNFIGEKVISFNEMEDKTRYYATFETNESVIHRCYEDAKMYDEFFKDAVDDNDYLNENGRPEPKIVPEEKTEEVIEEVIEEGNQ